MKLRPYPEYKDSGVPWLGQVPKDWQLVPGLAVLGEKNVKNTGLKETTVLSLSYGKIVIKPAEKLHGLVPESFETYQIVEPGDIIIRGTDLQNDKVSLRVGKVNDRGIITSAYICLYPKNVVDSDYLYLLLHTYDLKKVYYGLGSGLRQNLEFEDFKRLPIALPRPKEQTQIARFLDWKTTQIDRFICNKRRLIELLKEQKQALINQAVTGRIDVRTGKPYPGYKDSGVLWLGKVPVHWEVQPIKHITKINSDVLPESTSPDYKFRYIEISDVGTGELVNEPEIVTFGKAPSRARRCVKPGDTIISTVRTYLKAVLHITEDLAHVVVSTGFAVFRPKATLSPTFLGYVVRGEAFINQVMAESVGVSYPAIAETRLGSLKVAFPKDIEEQNQIVSFIEKSSEPLTMAITRTQREIDLMQEYRTRLISDVVTGKLDVRDVEVPEVDESEEALDEGVITGDAVAQDNLEVTM